MPVHLFAGGIQEHLGGDRHDLVLLEQGHFLIRIDQAKFHLVAVLRLQLRHDLLHLLTGDAVLGAEIIKRRPALGRRSLRLIRPDRAEEQNYQQTNKPKHLKTQCSHIHLSLFSD